MKNFLSALICLALCVALVFAVGCSKNPTDENSSNSDPSSNNPERPRGEALTEEELPFEKYIYESGFYSFNRKQIGLTIFLP